MKLSSPTPELSVPDVAVAQAYNRDVMGFSVAWFDTGGDIGAVNHGDCAIFFRKSDAAPQAGTFWMFADDVDAAYDDLLERGANITAPLADTSWGMRQFTVVDPYGNTFHIHHDL